MGDRQRSLTWYSMEMDGWMEGAPYVGPKQDGLVVRAEPTQRLSCDAHILICK